MELTSYLLGKKAGGGGGSVDDYFYTNIDHNTSYDDNYGSIAKKTPPLTLTSNVTSLNSCFMNGGFQSVDVSNWDTSNITDMGSMFSQCKKIEELDLSNFDTSNVMGMGSCFSGCSNLKKLDLSSWNNNRVNNSTGMTYMFSGCYKLAILDISSMSSGIKGNNAFFNCGDNCLQSDGAYADGIPYVYVKDAYMQTRVITSKGNNVWTTANVIIKEQ